MPGSYNDLNVLYRLPLLIDLFEGRAPPVNFTVNGNQYGMAYYLTDGIYPKWATFIRSITEPQTPKARLFDFPNLNSRLTKLSAYEKQPTDANLSCFLLDNFKFSTSFLQQSS